MPSYAPLSSSEWERDPEKVEETKKSLAQNDVIVETSADFAADIYGLFSAILVRDLHNIAKEQSCFSSAVFLRVLRIFTNGVFLGITIFLQVYFLQQVKRMVTPEAVKSIRENYSLYEQQMYGTHIHQLNTGFWRGDGFEYMDASKFDGLSKEVKDAVCSIPLSQPDFFFLILLVWTIRVTDEFKQQLKWWWCMIWQVETDSNCDCVTSMQNCFNTKEQDLAAADAALKLIEKAADDNIADKIPEQESDEKTIQKLPACIKLLLIICVGLPRLRITCYVLWLGCRWLAATCGFGDLLLNAVALEFIIKVKELIYTSLIPYRSKEDGNTTKMPPFSARLEFGAQAGLGSVVWFLLAISWVYIYMYHIQTVLPDYQQDVRVICASYLKEKFSINAPPMEGPVRLI